MTVVRHQLSLRNLPVRALILAHRGSALAWLVNDRAALHLRRIWSALQVHPNEKPSIKNLEGSVTWKKVKTISFGDGLLVVVVVDDSRIQRSVIATEETTATQQQISLRPIECHSRLWSQRGTKVNGSHHGDNPLLRPTGIQIATKSHATLQAMAPDQYQNCSSNLLTPHREQPQSTRIVVAYPRLAFPATKRTNYASTSFDRQVQVSQGRTSYKTKENCTARIALSIAEEKKTNFLSSHLKYPPSAYPLS